MVERTVTAPAVLRWIPKGARRAGGRKGGGVRNLRREQQNNDPPPLRKAFQLED